MQPQTLEKPQNVRKGDESNVANEQMGFVEGWGAALDQVGSA